MSKILNFTATWCGPCQRIKPTLEEMEKLYKVKIEHVDVDDPENARLLSKFGISNIIPVTIFMNDNVEKLKVLGADVEKIKQGFELLRKKNQIVLPLSNKARFDPN
jgi:thiol-disulfide isomerase/thioredoxin